MPGFRLSSPHELIDEARNGRMFILVDDEDRENEGDLVIPAQMATPDAINFMATHGRGLICLALTQARANTLGLKPMSRHNGTRHETAFTVSIEAKEGVTTGISAADRARTIAVATNSAFGATEIVTPGHVFPLVAREGGVLVRAGHTEAAVDIARLAGLNPSGVICEIMRDDGTMARMNDLAAFARAHDMKIGTIRDLIDYRCRYDRSIDRLEPVPFVSRWGGMWTAIPFRNAATGVETLCLVKGEIEAAQPTPVRMHGISLMSDMLGGHGARSSLLRQSMRLMAEAGRGVIVFVSRSQQGILHRSLSPEAPFELGDYGEGAQVLTELGVRDMVLLTDNPGISVALQGYGLAVSGVIPVSDAEEFAPPLFRQCKPSTMIA